MKQWEYIIHGDMTATEMNSLGQEGWELVSYSRNADFKMTSVYIFKRPITEPKETE